MNVEWRELNGEWSAYVDSMPVGSVYFMVGHWHGSVSLEIGKGFTLIAKTDRGTDSESVKMELNRLLSQLRKVHHDVA